MSPLSKDLYTDLILPDMKASSSRQVLQALAAEVSFRANVNSEMLFEQLLGKEEKSSSGIGGGIAIPHLQLAGLAEPFMLLARLSARVDFNAVDHQDVDLVFLLLSPAEEGPLHLRRLSRISRALKSEELCHELRTAKDAHTMRGLLGMPEAWLMAA